MNDDDKLWCGLTWLGLIICAIPSIIILLIKKDESEAIKFQSFQAIGFFAVTFVINIVFVILQTIAGIVLAPLALVVMLVSSLFSLAVLGYWIFLVVKVFTGDNISVPVLGDFINDKLM